MLTPQQVQPPEGKKHRNLLAHCSRPRGDNEGSNRLVQIAAEDNHCRPILHIPHFWHWQGE
ncbi:hypothetical protein D3C74_397650 [compost metagenome]